MGVPAFPASGEIAYPHSGDHADNLFHWVASSLMLNRVSVPSVLLPVGSLGSSAKFLIEVAHWASRRASGGTSGMGIGVFLKASLGTI